MKKIITTLLILTLMAACSPQTATGPAPVSSAGIVPTDSPAASGLTAADVKNAAVSLTTLTDDMPLTYQLKDGKYNAGTDPAADGYASISLLDLMAFGDLNGDGQGDAAVLVTENYGGSGVFVSLVVFQNENGTPVQVAITPIDDRPAVNTLSIEGGLISLDAVIHGFEDPMCCPSLETTRHYVLENSQLVLRDFSTQTPDAQWRTISITSPSDGASGSSVQVTGTVSIAPFENNLSYHIYGDNGIEITAGPVPVTAADMGAPGTFDTLIALNNVPSGMKVRIEIQDLSAADGSLLAMDSVILQVK